MTGYTRYRRTPLYFHNAGCNAFQTSHTETFAYNFLRSGLSHQQMKSCQNIGQCNTFPGTCHTI